MPIVIQRKKTFIGLLGLAVNTDFNYPNYFVMSPAGPDAKLAFTKGFFEVALRQNPPPQSVAIVAADQEFSRNAADGARENAKQAGLKVVYERTYPPATADFAPIVRAVAASNPELMAVASYPPDSVGIVRAVNELGFKPKAIGGAMVGSAEPTCGTQNGLTTISQRMISRSINGSAPVDAETGVFMLLYLDHSYDKAQREGRLRNPAELQKAVVDGAARRVRPKFMTVATMFIGLLPIMWSAGSGSDVMKRIAAPMIGGIFTSFLLELVVYPVIYEVWKWNFEMKRQTRAVIE
jgi:hypothetical protein